jgi:hypothetical protein
MPLAIFSHQGLVLPLKMRSPKRLDGTSLLIGSAISDCMVWVSRFSFITNNLPYTEYMQFLMHSVIGILITLPITVIFAWLFSVFFAPFISTKVGTSKIGLYFGLDDWKLLGKRGVGEGEKIFNGKWIFKAIYSAFLGIISHYFMDMVGHHLNPFLVPFEDYSVIPGWNSQIAFYTSSGNPFYNAYFVWLAETFIIGLFCFIWLRVIAKNKLLKLWYGKLNSQETTTINVWTGYNEYEYRDHPPFKTRITYFNKNLHIGYKWYEFWIKPTLKNAAIVLFVMVSIGTFFEWLPLGMGWYVPPPGTAPLWQRLFSMSHIMIYIGLLSIIFDEKYIRSWFILFIPLLAILIYVLVFELPGTPLENQILPALLSHAPHFAIAIYLAIRKKWTDWQYLIHAGIVYFSYLLLLWIIIPDYKMIWIYGQSETLCLIVWSTYIITVITMIVSYFVKQGRYRGPIIKDGNPET